MPFLSGMYDIVADLCSRGRVFVSSGDALRDVFAAFRRSSDRRFAVLALCLLIPFLQAVQAQTTVSGAVSVDTRWGLNGSPYVIENDVQVQGGSVLTIDPGVIIYMGANASLTVQSGGLRVAGTSAQPVKVLSDKTRLAQQAAPGDWRHWVFTSGAVNSRLDHVLFEHGRGLLIQASSPVLNNLDIRNSLGAAITVDLAASPSGVGNRAVGNTLNGISVPAGDLTGNIKWALRGIPYVLTSGQLSVGESPVISRVSPASVQQGQTVTLTLEGKRLDPMSKIVFSKPGLSAVVFAGGSSSQKHVQLTVASNAPFGPVDLRATVDAGEVSFANAFAVAQPGPVLAAITPTKLTTGMGASEITLTGQNFVVASEALFNSASVSTRYVSATQLVATLPNQINAGSLTVQVRSPDDSQAGESLLSNSLSLTVEAAIPPTVSFAPTPIALPPDGKARQISLRLSRADYRDHVINLSMADPSKATVSPASVTIPAGQTDAVVNVVPLISGTTSLAAESPSLSRVVVPVFVTTEFRGASTAYASPVGVLVEKPNVAATREMTLHQSPVGVAVGGVLTAATPSALVRGAAATLRISGASIPASASVSILPETGISLGIAQVDVEGKRIDVSVTTASDAPLGKRRLVVKNAAGAELIFANPENAMIQVLPGLPSLLSIEPVFLMPGTTSSLKVRGKNLQQAVVRVLPGDGINIDTAPQVNANGDELTASIQVLPGAATGPRVVQIITPAGASAAQANETNTLLIASAQSGRVTPVASPLVGIVVGSGGTGQASRQEMPLSPTVGVVLGAAITQVFPSSGVIGTDVTLRVTGSGLGNVTALGFAPETGLTLLAPPSIAPDGKELTVAVRIAGDAPLGLRRLALLSADKPLPFVRPADMQFLVSAPLPELASVTPTILVAGQAAQKVIVRGKNLRNILGVRVAPADGVTISGPFESNVNATELSFTAQVAANAASGARVVMISTPAGESTAASQAGNTLHVASQLGPTYANILSAPVGVAIGSSTAETRADSLLLSPMVGVMLGSGDMATSSQGLAASLPVGVVIGAGAQRMSPGGWLKGANGEITVTGVGLGAAVSVAARPATGLLLGQPVVSGNGGQLTVSIAVAPDAPEVVRELQLQAADGRLLPFVTPSAALFGIGSLPTMSSVTPIILQQGKSATLNIRGTNLKGVIGAELSGGGVTLIGSQIAWSQDAYGELLTLPVVVDGTAVLGTRVLRLQVAGGMTSAEAGPANSINVVPPQ